MSGFNWREHLAVHPAAELFPLMSEAELKELAADIEKNGPRQDIVLCGDPRSGLDNCQLVDGRNRLDALAMLGFLGVNDGGGLVVTKQFTKDGKWIESRRHQPFCYYLKGEDPYALALSLNVHRRHLTAEQKRDLIAKLLKAQPEKSDRAIATAVKADHKTVGSVRAEKEATGEIPQLEKTTGKDGKSRKTKRAAADKPEREAVSAVDNALVEFDAHLLRLLKMTCGRNPERFTATAFDDSNLKQLGCFLLDLADLVRDDASASAEAMKAKHAASEVTP